MQPYFVGLFLLLVLAVLFDFSNGFHDSANQVAGVISSRALSPEIALFISAASVFVGATFLGTRVANTIGGTLIDMEIIGSSGFGLLILISALVGAFFWNLITWHYGIPSSSSHALIGGLMGAFISGAGTQGIQWNKMKEVILAMFLSPLVGFILTYLFTKLTFFISSWSGPRANIFFKSSQIFSLVAQSLAHGTNDAQKTMGIITFGLILLNLYHPPLDGPWVPFLVMLISAFFLAFGILVGGWKIIKKLGGALYAIRPIHAFASQTVSASIIALNSILGLPISTTQVISSSIMGAGAGFRPKQVRWAIAGDFFLTWLITIPASCFISALFCGILIRILR